MTVMGGRSSLGGAQRGIQIARGSGAARGATAGASPSQGGPTVSQLISEGLRHVGASYSSSGGQRTWSKNVDKPPSFDCSGFIQYLLSRVGSDQNYDISNNQYRISKSKGLDMSVEQARNTAGALLFKIGEGPAGHVAISLGNGDTLEASSGAGGVRVVKGGAFRPYYTAGARIPGLEYDGVNVGDLEGVTTGDEFSAPPSANDASRDPAYQLASMVALISGVPAEDVNNQMGLLGAQAEALDGQSGVSVGDDLDKFLQAIRQEESGENYQARYQGPLDSGPDVAAGAYQFIGSTWRSNARGISNAQTADQASPEEQDAVARKYAQSLYSKYGDWKLAAVAWFGGPGIANKAQGGQDPGAPAGQRRYFDYADTIVNKMRGGS